MDIFHRRLYLLPQSGLYHRNNIFTPAKLGNYIQFYYDSRFSAEWEIAGFNCEHNQTAADGTVYDNGYGILLIPKTYINPTFSFSTI